MKILVAEDDMTTRFMLQGVLTKWGYEVVACADGEQAWEALKDPASPQLALLDWEMPGLCGDEVCRKVRGELDESDRYHFLVLLTSRDNQEDIIAGLESGADDYLSKPYHPEELRVRISAGRRIIELQRDLAEAKEALREQAMRDPLTKAFNRRAVLGRLETDLARGQRDGSLLTAVMCDIDHFKLVNDNHGHQAGDEVLIEFVQRVQSVLRPYDCLGRYGGEEFNVIAPGAAGLPTESLYERMRAVIDSKTFKTSVGEIPISASFGVASVQGTNSRVWHEEGEKLMQTLIGAADEALYRAKERGRNRVEFAS